MLKIGTKLHSKSFGEVEVIRKLGEGGQGFVYLIHSSSGDYALKWYLPQWASSEQKNALHELVAKGLPNQPVGAGKRFVWPLDVLEADDGLFGYLMDVIDTNRFVEHSLVRGKRKEQPNLATLCEISFQLVHSFRALHLTGYCYKDISDRNILFDPSTGDILICDNDNVGIDGASPGQIKGTLDFMAPEVIMEKENPSTLTDLHSLATLLFWFWMWHHPFHGAQEASIRCFGPEEKKQLYGENPCFIFDPNNTSNSLPQEEEYATVRTRWGMCPPSIRDMFIKAFTVGLLDPRQRVTEGAWRPLFLKLKDGAYICGMCQAEVIVDINAGSNVKCWDCGHSMPLPAKLVLEKNNTKTVLPLLLTTKLRVHHIDSASDAAYEETETILGEIAKDPKNPKLWGLRNKSHTNWDVRLANGSVKQLVPGRAAPLNTKTEIYVKGVKIRVEA